MSLLNRALAPFAPGLALRREREALQFKALQTVASAVTPGATQETKWRGASRVLRSLFGWMPKLGSATGDLPRTERATLIARSRDAYRGHMLARAAVARGRTNIVGTGLIPHAAVDAKALGLTEDQADELNESIDRWFRYWAESPTECDAEATLDFYGNQALALVSAMLAGDCFALTPFEERPGGIFGTKVQLVEADRVSNPNDGPNTETLVDGIQIDARLGAPEFVYIRTRHAQDPVQTSAATWEPHRVFGLETGRRRVLQVWNDKERPGQVRGAPYLAPILEPLLQLTQFSRAELAASVAASMLTVFIEKAAPATLDANGNPVPAINGTDSSGNLELAPAAVLDLAAGEKANLVNPTRPNAQFDPFFIAVVKQIGAALELPLDELLLHYQSSYSAARAAMLQAWRFYTMRRWWLVQQFCAPLRALVIDEMVARGLISAPGYADPILRCAYQACVWVGPARGSMDEEKEARAAKTRIEIGVSNEAIETAAMQGEAWPQVYAQRRKELKQRAKDGLAWAPSKATAAPPRDPSQAPSEPPAPEDEPEQEPEAA